MRNRIIAATPMICLIVYLCLGFIGGLWHPGWVVFFLIPMVPALLGQSGIKACYSLICLGVYLFIGFMYSWWHPGWIIFLTIPVFCILFPGKKVTSRIE